MKYLHLMHNSVYCAPFIEFIENGFEKTEHVFYIWGYDVTQKVHIPDPVGPNIHIITDRTTFAPLIMNMYAAKKVYINGLFFEFWLDFLVSHRWVLAKSNWIVWGGDLYYCKEHPQDSKWEKIEEKRKKIIPYFNEITTPIENYLIAREVYNVKGRRVDGPIPYPLNKDLLDRILVDDGNVGRKKYKVRVLVGHCADESVNHFEALMSLSKFKNENVEIVCPLSYGDFKVNQQVQKWGREIFGDKFLPIVGFMTTEQYAILLKSIDIGVFFTKIPQGASNIFALAYMGAKLYLHKDNFLYNNLQEKYHVSVFNVDHIAEETFEQFFDFSQDVRSMNKLNIIPRIDVQYARKIWTEQHFFL